jgi:uncharacterized protein with PQ loop repeat
MTDHIDNIGILLKSFYTQIAVSLVVDLGMFVALLEVKSLEHRKKLRYSSQLPQIKTAKETDKWALVMMLVVFFSQIVFLIYLIMATHRLNHLRLTSTPLSVNYITFLQALSLFLTLFVLSSEMKRWLEHAIRLKSANKLIGDVKFNMVFMQSMQYFTFF